MHLHAVGGGGYRAHLSATLGTLESAGGGRGC